MKAYNEAPLQDCVTITATAAADLETNDLVEHEGKVCIVFETALSGAQVVLIAESPMVEVPTAGTTAFTAGKVAKHNSGVFEETTGTVCGYFIHNVLSTDTIAHIVLKN